MQFKISKQNKIKFLSNSSEYSGVAKIASWVRNDMKLVTGFLPNETNNIKELGKNVVLYGTIGKSENIDQIVEKNLIDITSIEGKRECYLFEFVKDPFPGVDFALVIAGSDKRGTIYGLFHLSELMGVSPLVNWSDVKPAKRDQVILTEADNHISKEPSVKFRGFFINDEWPAFGNWASKRFGGINAKMYRHVFELLLRLKGNYLWPAMWASIFSEQGPGLASAQLANELGVVMGMSHHEPCLRHGEEYRYLRGKESIYGDAWNFISNREGIIKFWIDGLKRSGKFENVITVGMRGEQDTAIMGRDATLKDNIELLRDVIKTQKDLIKKNVNEDLEQVPMMLALYKEVEAYFYGDKTTEGLIKSKDLEDIILMLCDDNFGNLRTLPTKEMRSHKGGYGMYYHFDYHGWPVSYEWINSSYLPKVWEQMTTAYEFGIQDLWVVNVGDICTQEFPLSYFLDLAYDFDKWGISALNTTEKYTQQWVDKQFSGYFSKESCSDICEVLTEYTRIAHMRRPEAMNADVYHPLNYNESERMLCRVETVINKVEKLRSETPKEIMHAFYELVYYPAIGNMNLQKMHLLAGKNLAYAEQRRTEANLLAKQIGECIEQDKSLVNEFHNINNGKWYGMGLSEHVGFRHWCEEECAYPLQITFKPGNKPRIIVSVPGTSQYTEGGYWTGKALYLNDFMRPDKNEGVIDISNASALPTEYELSSSDWLKLSVNKGTVSTTDRITISIDRVKQGTDFIGEITVKSADNKIKIIVNAEIPESLTQPMTFMETNGYIAIEAEHFHSKVDTKDGEFKCLSGHGKTLSAMKAFPVTESFTPSKNSPYLEYHFVTSKAGNYNVILYMSPSNPVDTNCQLCFGLQWGSNDIVEYNAVPEGYKVGDVQFPWGKNVLDNMRTHTSVITCEKGLNKIRVYAISPGFVLERVVLHSAESELLESYLGPEESFFIEK